AARAGSRLASRWPRPRRRAPQERRTPVRSTARRFVRVAAAHCAARRPARRPRAGVRARPPSRAEYPLHVRAPQPRGRARPSASRAWTRVIGRRTGSPPLPCRSSASPEAYALKASVHADIERGYGCRLTTKPVDLEAAIATRFVATNGAHPMTRDDDYVSEWFTTLEDLASREGEGVDELRRLMLANRLPLPSYIRSDGAQMVPGDLLELPRSAGGFHQLPAHFAEAFDDPAAAVSEWDSYLAGHYVCLRSVTPQP